MNKVASVKVCNTVYIRLSVLFSLGFFLQVRRPAGRIGACRQARLRDRCQFLLLCSLYAPVPSWRRVMF